MAVLVKTPKIGNKSDKGIDFVKVLLYYICIVEQLMHTTIADLSTEICTDAVSVSYFLERKKVL